MSPVLPAVGARPAAATPQQERWSVHATTHVPALDGMRGVAVLVVLALHTFTGLPTDTWYGRLLRVTGLGWVGVDLFFVLSGFLITGLLLDSRGATGYYRTFYARRALRIWPLYFGLVGVLTVVSWALPSVVGAAGPAFLRNWPWYWTHTVNFQIARFGWSDATLAYLTGQFWSLGVEEQFYLVWPFVVATAGARRLPRVCAALWAVAVASRVALVLAGDRMEAIYTLPITRVDGLLAGGVLACAARDGAARLRIVGWLAPLAASRVRLWLAAFAWLLALLLVSGGIAGPLQRWAWPLGWPPVAALGGAVMLALAITRAPDAPGLLVRPALRWMGGISYGLYVLHPPMIWVVAALDRHHALHLPLLVGRGAALALTFAAALLSWHLWERPWLSLRARFPYASPTPDDAHRAGIARPLAMPTRDRPV